MLHQLRQRLASWTVIGIFGAIYGVSQTLIAITVRALGIDMLRVQTTLDPEVVRAIFAHWDAAGSIGDYAAHYRYDMIHPLWYGTLLAAMLAKGFEDNEVSASWDAFLLLPFVAALCDVGENIVHLSFLADRNAITATNVLIGNGAALTKWALSGLSLFVAIVLGIARARRHVARGAVKTRTHGRVKPPAARA
jgi:hypothetical protein